IFGLGAPLGFNLLIDFGGTRYKYLGNFSQLRPEVVLWRARMLERALNGRRASFPHRIASGAMTTEQAALAETIFRDFEMWLIVNADKDKRQVTDALAKQPLAYGTQVFSLADVERELELLGGAA